MLSDYGRNLMQPIQKPEITTVDVGGTQMKAFIFKDKKLMSPGVWNGLYYSPEQLTYAFANTDWTDARLVALYGDHDDLKTSSWKGFVRNPRMDGEHQMGDLVVVDEDYAKMLTFGAKFGISPKIKGQRVQDAIISPTYENFSFVVDPACKTTWLNSQQADSSDSHTTDNSEIPTMANEKTEQPKEEAMPQVEASTAAEDKTADVVKTLADSITSGMKEVSDGMKAGFDGISQKIDSLAVKKLAEEPPEAEEPKGEKPEEQPEEPPEEPAEEEKVETKDIPADEPEPAAIKTGGDGEVTEIKNSDAAMAKYMQSLDGTQTFELSLEPEDDKKSTFMSWTLATTATSVSSTRGTAISGYALNPIIWAKNLIDAGKIEMKFRASVREAAVPKGNKTLIMPIRNAYEDSWETSAEEYAIDTNILATEINDMDGVEFSPTRYNFRIAVTNKNLNINGVNLMSYFREELAYKWAKDVDEAIAAALVGATAAADTAPGAMDLYGGDATTLATLEAGDTLDTDMIAEGIKLLESKFNYYWTGGVLTKDTTLKNPWNTDGANPVLLYIAPEQMEDLRTDSQFVNASEYGNSRPLLSGEIGEYLGARVIKSNSTPAYANFGGGTIDGHKCLMVKSRMCGGLAWGQKPEMKAFDWPIADKKMMTLNLEYGTGILHGDAIVRLNVTDA